MLSEGFGNTMEIGYEKTRKLYLNGKSGTTDREIEIVNPATEQVFAKVFALDKAQLQLALDAAESSFAGAGVAEPRKIAEFCSTAWPTS